MRALRRAIGWLFGLAAAAALTLAGFAFVRQHPQDLPWTPLNLGEPIGVFTGRKLTALTGDFPGCRAVLDRAGVRYAVLPERHEGGCGYADAVRFTGGGSRGIAYRPARLGVSCAVAAGLSVWEWNVLQPAAERRFGARVAAVEHFGSYSCRRLYGRVTGTWSEHATADAVDVAGIVLTDGRRITVARDWKGQDQKAAFLREVRDGARRLFATTLSPDYNAAHRDHLHLDQAERGAMGWRTCR